MVKELGFIIVSQDKCSYCDKAKALMAEHQIGYTEINISQATWLKTILKNSNFKTVPLIFDIYGELIGGYTELEKHLND